MSDRFADITALMESCACEQNRLTSHGCDRCHGRFCRVCALPHAERCGDVQVLFSSPVGCACSVSGAPGAVWCCGGVLCRKCAPAHSGEGHSPRNMTSSPHLAHMDRVTVTRVAAQLLVDREDGGAIGTQKDETIRQLRRRVRDRDEIVYTLKSELAQSRSEIQRLRAIIRDMQCALELLSGGPSCADARLPDSTSLAACLNFSDDPSLGHNLAPLDDQTSTDTLARPSDVYLQPHSIQPPQACHINDSRPADFYAHDNATDASTSQTSVESLGTISSISLIRCIKAVLASATEKTTRTELFERSCKMYIQGNKTDKAPTRKVFNATMSRYEAEKKKTTNDMGKERKNIAK